MSYYTNTRLYELYWSVSSAYISQAWAFGGGGGGGGRVSFIMTFFFLI